MSRKPAPAGASRRPRVAMAAKSAARPETRLGMEQAVAPPQAEEPRSPPGRGRGKPSGQAADQPPGRGRRRKQGAPVADETPRGPPPQVRIDIDPAMTGGYIHDRYDVEMHGRVVSSAAVEEAALLLDGAVVARVQYGPADDTASTVLADGTSATRRGFRFNLPLRSAEANRKYVCVIAARTQGGHTHEETFELSIDPASAVPLSVISGLTHAAATQEEARPPIILYVERAVLDDTGRLQVHGWAVSFTAMVTVQVFTGEERPSAAKLGGKRDDVAKAFPAYPNARMSGFSLSANIDKPLEELATVRIQALSRDGFSQEVTLPVERVRELEAERPPDQPPLAAAPVPLRASARAPSADPRRLIRLFCDAAALDIEGNVTVSGWAVCAVGVSAIIVHLDGEAIGEAELGLLREDVGEEYRSIPLARFSGFHFTKNVGGVKVGEHRIRVVVRNVLDDLSEEVRTVLIERPEPEPDALPQFRFEIDNPRVVAGMSVKPISGRLTIEGWALARSGMEGVDVLLDDQRLGEAHYGGARQDVGAAFPDWPGALRSGLAFHCPPRSLRDGEHVVQLTLRARNGEELHHRFRIEVRKSEEDAETMTIRRRMSQVESDVSAEVLDGLGHHPSFRLVLRQDATLDLDRLLATLGSLRGQVYRDWSLRIIAADADTATGVRLLLAESASDIAERIAVTDPSDEAAFEQPIGTGMDAWHGFLLPGDELGCDALLEMALASGLHRDAELLYADELRVSPASREREPFFKPDFSPDLLLSSNYIGRPWFASTALLGRCGVTPRSLLESGEYDTVLRCAELTERIHHLPKLLCRRGMQQIDAAELEAEALERAAGRRGIQADVHPGCVPGTWRFRRTQPVSGMVSIIIPTCGARGCIETCIKTLRDRTAYRNFEIICIDNIPNNQVAWKIWLKRNADKVVSMPDAFNWSRFNNRGVEAAAGEYLLFLNDDTEVEQPDWLDAMLEHVQRPEVAIVGPQLLYPDGKVQHAGMFLATLGTARHAFRFSAADEPGYFGLALTQRNVIAVTGACMLMRRSMYQALGGFDESHQIINNDLDLCLRAHQAGKLTVFTPYASLVHHEAVSRDRLKDDFDISHFEHQWKTLFAAGDPYFSPLLTLHSDDYRPDDEPVQTVFAGHPLFGHDEVKRILVVKVDHIGDFVTAVPAIRRLKQIFPAATIHVLASRAVGAFAGTLDCVDEFIEFEFFHAVSGLGPKEIGKEEYQALRAKLTPYRFDIAVDLRKHLDTREVLRYTPARILAGYDYIGQFPFLDVTLEWEGDKNLYRKRSHVTDDLINLVDAIGTACAAERTRLDLVTPGEGPPDFLVAEVRALFAKPVVAVHPGVGNAMRQWPAEHFATLIDLLVEQNAVNVVLIGGPEEAELTEQVLAQTAYRDSVASLAGKTPLRDLPALLAACALYVGNNSGPKHIAAAIGVPTIGIHSGVVDAIEWGPIGRRAVALRRDMSCSPCYLARMEDCPRNYACMRGLEPASVRAVSELFLGRPVERRLVSPLVEPEWAPDVQAAGAIAPGGAGRKSRRSRKSVIVSGPDAGTERGEPDVGPEDRDPKGAEAESGEPAPPPEAAAADEPKPRPVRGRGARAKRGLEAIAEPVGQEGRSGGD